jgi:hypothetical protein
MDDHNFSYITKPQKKKTKNPGLYLKNKSYCELNNFVKENSKTSKLKIFYEIEVSFWYSWKVLNEWDFLKVVF